MPTAIKGQPPSSEIRKRLAAQGKPVLVAFSTGKDALACELALRDAGVETRLAYLYYIPGLSFVEETLSEQGYGPPIPSKGELGLSRHGVLKLAGRKVSPVADWLKGEVLGRIKAEGIPLPIDGVSSRIQP